MKKIGILTLYYRNFNMGGLLQAFALQKTLEKLGYEAEQISFDYLKTIKTQQNDSQNTKKIGLIRKIVRKLKYQYYFIRYERKFIKRKQAFLEFMDQIPHSERVYCAQDTLSDEYDGIVVGSDQVWADWMPVSSLEFYMLNGVCEHRKKYSYAASIGTDEINHELDEVYRNGLDDFKGISVREKSAKNEIEKLLPDVSVRVDVDPTLLLTASQWSEIAKEKKYKKKYIFCYFLGKDREYRKQVQRLADQLKLPIVTMPYIKDNRKEKSGYERGFGTDQDYSSGPAEFVGLIRDAELVITDSFHAVAFSTQFHKKFYVLARKIEGSGSTNSRILDFLEEFQLTKQFVDIASIPKINPKQPIDFSVFDGKIEEKRKESMNYLKCI